MLQLLQAERMDEFILLMSAYDKSGTQDPLILTLTITSLIVTVFVALMFSLLKSRGQVVHNLDLFCKHRETEIERQTHRERQREQDRRTDTDKAIKSNSDLQPN